MNNELYRIAKDDAQLATEEAALLAEWNREEARIPVRTDAGINGERRIA